MWRRLDSRGEAVALTLVDCGSIERTSGLCGECIPGKCGVFAASQSVGMVAFGGGRGRNILLAALVLSGVYRAIEIRRPKTNNSLVSG